MPSERRLAIVSHDWRRAAGSKPVVGSSRKIRSGRRPGPARGPAGGAAAGEVGGAVRRRVGEPDELEQLLRRPWVRVGGAVELDRLAHLDRRVQPGLLEHDADLLPEAALALARVVAEHRDLAGVGLAVAFEDLDHRRLAGAVGAEQREHLAAGHREVHAVEGGRALRSSCAGRGSGRRRVNPSSCRTASVSSALLVIGAGVEPASPPVGGDGSTRAPMKAPAACDLSLCA